MFLWSVRIGSSAHKSQERWWRKVRLYLPITSTSISTHIREYSQNVVYHFLVNLLSLVNCYAESYGSFCNQDVDPYVSRMTFD